ncbi:hypothetical protein [Gilvimarinus algae]|uniref:Uncharacterized protein n=1 Tax=Gilvimarinus algae TaxID=3058037 RepID=A0ABT8TIM7_9GAMM|nr:hypothetical protein [Gilvimarinus sp. SDUM040014]MDO3383957.1 hypothetical protein [Gilvimarinus sp. SDUM040014]
MINRPMFLLPGLLTVVSMGASAEPLELESRFDSSEVDWVMQPGSATVSGTASIRLETGEQKGCGGFHVELLPAADYANERIFRTYGNNDQGQILMSQDPPSFTPDAKAYHELNLSAPCNEDNRFEFLQVPAGDYYAIGFIIWSEGDTKKGGGVMKRIRVTEGESLVVDI